MIFAGIGLALSWFFVPSFGEAAARVERLSPLTAVTLAESPAGQEGLIEGRIAERNPVHFRLFVAYVRSEYRGRDDDDDAIWVEDERVTPPLLLDLPGGRVQLANNDYALQGRLVEWQSEANLTWDSASQEGTKSYRGLERGNPVLALGSIVEGPTGREFQAEWLYNGTRTTYIEDQRNSADIATWIGRVFLLIGAGLLGGGIWLLLR
jgi:hypothetical protein